MRVREGLSVEQRRAVLRVRARARAAALGMAVRVDERHEPVDAEAVARAEAAGWTIRRGVGSDGVFVAERAGARKFASSPRALLVELGFIAKSTNRRT